MGLRTSQWRAWTQHKASLWWAWVRHEESIRLWYIWASLNHSKQSSGFTGGWHWLPPGHPASSSHSCGNRGCPGFSQLPGGASTSRTCKPVSLFKPWGSSADSQGALVETYLHCPTGLGEIAPSGLVREESCWGNGHSIFPLGRSSDGFADSPLGLVRAIQSGKTSLSLAPSRRHAAGSLIAMLDMLFTMNLCNIFP